ncbi:hypothetical protein EVAR_100616_1 [Eumeta japonica]|uniref:Uncharacterized protein n=1 Tax=Eumeta variegata TaxID=151549 RepID=A0A4C1ZE37_EUMVA|nr:hypothetical protein EVAR_100616_1 [Eumeta japonica]
MEQNREPSHNHYRHQAKKRNSKRDRGRTGIEPKIELGVRIKSVISTETGINGRNDRPTSFRNSLYIHAGEAAGGRIFSDKYWASDVKNGILETNVVGAALLPTRVQHENGPVRSVTHHDLTEYRREVVAFAVAFRPISHLCPAIKSSICVSDANTKPTVLTSNFGPVDQHDCVRPTQGPRQTPPCCKQVWLQAEKSDGEVSKIVSRIQGNGGREAELPEDLVIPDKHFNEYDFDKWNPNKDTHIALNSQRNPRNHSCATHLHQMKAVNCRHDKIRPFAMMHRTIKHTSPRFSMLHAPLSPRHNSSPRCLPAERESNASIYSQCKSHMVDNWD